MNGQEKQPAKRKRSFWSFSLRTMLIVIFAFACLLGWKANQVSRQRRAIQTIEAMGGRVNFENDPRLGVKTIKPTLLQRWLNGILPYDYLFDVHGVVINKGQDVGDLSFLKDLPHLKSLNLSSTNATDLSALSTLYKLKGLDLSETQVKDVSPLASLTNLEKLAMENTPLESIAPLNRLDKLVYLSLALSKVKDISSVSSMASLNEVKLFITPLEDIRPLEGAKKISYLDLGDTQVSDLSSLSKLNTLTYLSLSRTPTSDEDVAKLKKELKGCRINCNRKPRTAHIGK